MESLKQYVALHVGGEAVHLDEVLRLAKFSGKINFIKDAVNAVLIRQEAQRRGLQVTDDELQQAADDFRKAHGMHNVKTTQAWLKTNFLTIEDWELMLEQQVIAGKLRALLTNDKVEQYFAQNKLSYDTATISQILVNSEDVARELRAQIAEEEMDFHALARQYSLDAANKPAGGYVGSVRRTDMEAAVESAVYGATPGKIVGPLKTDAGWLLVKVEELHPATLNETTRERIESLLFDEWLSEQRRKAQISFDLLEAS